MTPDSFARELGLKHNKLQCGIKSFLTGLLCSALKGNTIHQDTIALLLNLESCVVPIWAGYLLKRSHWEGFYHWRSPGHSKVAYCRTQIWIQATKLEGGGGVYYLYTYEYSEMLLRLYFVSFHFYLNFSPFIICLVIFRFFIIDQVNWWINQDISNFHWK